MIRFALIGAGKMGERWAGVLSKNQKLAAIADTGSGKAKKLAADIPDCRATNIDQIVLEDKDIDAVLIATTHKYLAPLTAAALKAGKHVLCEKPGAIKSADIKKNIALAESVGRTYMVGFNHRFHDGFIKARRLYKDGAIGDVIFIRARYGFGGRLGYDKEWRLNKSISGGGHLLDQGVHMIDLSRSFMAEIKSVHGIRGDKFWKKGVEDNGFVLLQDKDKAIASIHASLTQWKPLHNFEIYGTKGYLSVEGLGRKYGNGEKLIVGRRAKDFDREVKEKTIVCNSNADDSLKLELEEFVSAIKQRRNTSPSPTDAFENLRIIEKVYSASKL